MSALARLWTDGSCVYDDPHLSGSRGFGGYAAVVRRGGYTWERRGRVEQTTAVRMELTAIVEGLRSLPDAVRADAMVDCTIALVVQARWRDGLARRNARHRRDGELWASLIEQLERVDVRFVLLGKGPRCDEHNRAHQMAGEEAKSLAAGLPYPALVSDRNRLRAARRKLSGPPPPSRAWEELAALARNMRQGCD